MYINHDQLSIYIILVLGGENDRPSTLLTLHALSILFFVCLFWFAQIINLKMFS